MTLLAEERMDLHVHPGLKLLVLKRAEAAGQSLNEAASELLCKALGVDPATYRIPRKTPGRKPNQPKKRGNK